MLQTRIHGLGVSLLIYLSHSTFPILILFKPYSLISFLLFCMKVWLVRNFVQSWREFRQNLIIPTEPVMNYSELFFLVWKKTFHFSLFPFGGKCFIIQPSMHLYIPISCWLFQIYQWAFYQKLHKYCLCSFKCTMLSKPFKLCINLCTMSIIIWYSLPVLPPLKVKLRSPLFSSIFSASFFFVYV